MITLYYLKDSCSHRIAWLLEELGLDYELQVFDRDPQTHMAPPELKKQHPLGKAPVLRDGDLLLSEGVAMIQHLLDRYDTDNRLTPTRQTDAHSRYLYWLSISASLFSANLVHLLSRRADLGSFGPHAAAQVGLYFDHVEQELAGKRWIVGDQLTGADFALSFPLQWGLNQVTAADYPNISRYVEQIEAFPSYRRVAERTGCGLELGKF